MNNEDKAKEIAAQLWTGDEMNGAIIRGIATLAAIKMAEWKDQLSEQKLKEFEKWLYNKQSDFEYEDMREELVGLNAAIEKFEELGL